MFNTNWVAVGSRLEEMRLALNIKSKRQVALAIGADTSYYSRALKGGPLSEDYIEAIAAEFNVNKDWLLFGEGEMFLGGQPPKKSEIKRKSKKPVSTVDKKDLVKQVRNLMEASIRQKGAIKVLLTIVLSILSKMKDKSDDPVFDEIQKVIREEQQKLFDELL